MVFDESQVRRGQPGNPGKFRDKTHSVPDSRILAAALPTISLENLTHIGSLDRADKGTTSYEGQGLSVSTEPDAWEEIGRFGGRPRWQFACSNRFLNHHGLDAELVAAIKTWGIDRGYIECVEAWQVTYWDDEYEENRTFVLTSEEEAHEESEEIEGQVTPILTTIATTDFPDSTVEAGDIDVLDVLTTVWVNEATDLDGVWWEDDLDPTLLSAPRGVIVPRAIDDWVRSAVKVQ